MLWFKSLMSGFIKRIYPSGVDTMTKNKKIIFYLCFFFLLTAFFISVLFQNPIFVQKNLNLVSNVIWIPLLILLICLDYKKFFKSLIFIFFLIIPFGLYLLIAFVFQHSVLTLPFVRTVFIVIILLLVGLTYSPYKNNYQIKCFSLAYIIASIILVLIVYFTSLRGQDISSQIYSYETKNSTGPILLIACVLLLNVFEENKIINNVCICLFSLFFVVAIGLMKSRTALITAPIIFYIIFVKRCKNSAINLIILFSFVGLLILLFAVPFLRNNIVINILLNGKTDLDSIFSGRISGIVEHLHPNNVFLGNMSGYVDCMPINIYYNFGIFGLASLLPILAFPYYVVYKIRSKKDSISYTVILLLIILLTINSLFEAYGLLGPGVKVFAFWVLLSFEPEWLWSDSKLFKPVKRIVLNKRILSKDFFSIFLTSLTILFTIAITVPQVSNSISKRIYNAIPSSSETTEYIPVESIDVSGEHIMCVGQTAHFSASVFPNNATDSGVFWTGWGASNYLDIDRNKGTVYAKGIATANLCCASKKDTSIYSLYLISTVSPSQYEFNDFKIFSDSETILLDKNNTQSVFFSREYVPETVDVSFYSTNDSIAYIDNEGTVRGISTGECEVYASITNEIGTFESNKIKVIVSGNQGIAVTNFNVEFDAQCFANTPINFSTSFNQNVNDTGLFSIVDGGKKQLCTDSFLFKKPGDHIITFISRNNASVFLEKKITVKENLVKQIVFEKDRWIKVGEKLDITPTLLFDNGFKRLANEDDLNLSYDTSKRAWHNKNGLCDNEFTFAAIITGDSRVNYYFKTDASINIAIDLTISNIGFNEYNRLLNQIGYVLLCISIIPTCVVFLTLDFNFRKKWFWVFGIFMFGIPTLVFALMKIFDAVTIVCLVIALLSSISAILFSIISKTRINILCEPNNKEIKERIQDEFYIISI